MSENTLYLKELSKLNKDVFNSRKSIWKAYALAFFLGWTGVHWAYLENKKLSTARIGFTIAISIFAIILFFLPLTENLLFQVAVLFFIITAIWNIVDLFLISDFLDEMSAVQERKIKKQILAERDD